MTTSAENATTVNALAELARQVRRSTLELLHVPHTSWLTWSPRGTSNHILWHAGHALWLQDALTIQPLTGRGELSTGWERTFGQNSRPEFVDEWPAEAKVRVLLEKQLDRILDLLNEHAARITSNPTATPCGGSWPLVRGMIHAWHDEARHQGEMYLLHKLMRVESSR